MADRPFNPYDSRTWRWLALFRPDGTEVAGPGYRRINLDDLKPGADHATFGPAFGPWGRMLGVAVCPTETEPFPPGPRGFALWPALTFDQWSCVEAMNGDRVQVGLSLLKPHPQSPNSPETRRETP